MTYWLIAAGLLAFIVAIAGATVVIRRLYSVLPKPETFAEGQRLIFGWLASFAGIFCGLLAQEMILLLMWGGWSPAEEHTIVVIFGCTLGGFVAAMIVVIIGLMIGGPVGRFSGEVGKDGLKWEAGKDHGSVTTKVEITNEEGG